MTTQKPIVLLTGFGPFPGVEVNLSNTLVSEVADAARARFTAADVLALSIPTLWTTAPAAICEAIARHRPAVVLMIGVSGTATVLTLEIQAANVCGDTVDAAGCRAAGTVIAPNGPDVLQATWPLDWITERLSMRQIPWRVSDDAGRYICNASLYEVLARSAAGWGVAPLTGFIHIPRAFAPPATLSVDQARNGCIEIIDVCLQSAARVSNPQQALTVPPV